MLTRKSTRKCHGTHRASHNDRLTAVTTMPLTVSVNNSGKKDEAMSLAPPKETSSSGHFLRSDIKPRYALSYSVDDYAQLQRYNRRMAYDRGRLLADGKMEATMAAATVDSLELAVFQLMRVGYAVVRPGGGSNSFWGDGQTSSEMCSERFFCFFFFFWCS